MTQISRDDVLHLAQLSSLELNETEIDCMQTDIGNILNYVEKLRELDTSNIEPRYQVTGLNNVWREDIVDETNYGVTREELLDRSIDPIENQVKVPKVL